MRGQNILAQQRSLTETAKALGVVPEQANERLLAALRKLRAGRGARPRPHLDDKVITANNGLMISALAKGHQVLGVDDPFAGDGIEWQGLSADDSAAGSRSHSAAPISDLLHGARKAAEFIERELFDAARGVLFRTWRNGRGATEGFAEDYAFFIQGLLDLYEASFEVRWLRWAERLQEKMDEVFWDQDGGGYFNSAAGDASILLRLKEDYDGAEPAPSSVAAMNLLRLAAMVQREPWRERGRACLEAFRTQWSKAPHAMPQMLCALELALEPPRHVVLAGDPGAEDFRALAAAVHERLGPRRILLGATGGSDQAWLAQRAPWLAEMKPVEGRATAYVCEEFACKAPTSDAAELRRLLE